MEEGGLAATSGFLQEKQDSDQSVSEEEDMDDDKWLTNDNSLSGPSGNKGGIGVLSQLELLTDVKRLHHSAHTLNSHQLQKQTGLCKEDDVEVPSFKSQGGDFINKNDHWMALSCCLDDGFSHVSRTTPTSNSEEEIMSDDEMRPSADGNLRRDGKSTLPKVSAECKSGVFLNKDAGSSSSYSASSKLNRSSKGRRGKSKPKFLFQSWPLKKDFALVVHDTCQTSTPLSVLPLNVELDMQRNNIEALDDLLEDFGGKEIQQFEEDFGGNDIQQFEEDFGGNEIQQFQKHLVPSEVAVVHDPNEHSMAEFLDHFQHTSSRPQGNSRMQLQTKRQGSRFLQKRNLLLLGDRNMSNDDQPEALDSDSSTDEDEIPQILQPAIPQRTMADQFHLALGAVSTNERLSIARPRQFGLSGKLQQLMQCEKDRDTYFLEKSQTHDASSAKSFIDVRILSCSLEAKLTVCFCALLGDEEVLGLTIGTECLSNPQKRKGTGGRKLTIIFSSRICKDVELEIGNFIRIHQPWKEVHVNEKDESIILCAYFSQI
ncbi:PREDICTED: uncharacterized protein LOC109220270 isoform X4 [Nicotiana attenuata]|uniref:uncharacterized protein LOC109220270 isoform X4 n=1 Tax=Nicotiana attenuata TaxID=49451 RepID=UPI0009053D61|nr:PREDICTED: uncharacterized protein LOC109220270 isoform X4 [Nicotiana attenuata]